MPKTLETVTQLPAGKTLNKKAKLLQLAGEETRIRVLCFMFQHQEGCVSEIAEALDESVANISHHLQIMRDNGMFTIEKRGTNRCYRLADHEMMDWLRTVICES